jgi:diguanylate cyclase (GGDEF)-like protein
MDIDVLRKHLESKIRKHYIPPQYVYIAENFTHTKMLGVFSERLSEIPTTFLSLAKIFYKLHHQIPPVNFTNMKDDQFVELFDEGKSVLKIKYSEAHNELKIVNKIVKAFGMIKIIMDAVGAFSILENVSYVVTDALQSEDFDRMIFLLMTALTAGYGFGFNRVFLFEKNGDYFVGKKAIGPFNESEAHQLWERLEYNDYSLEEFAKHLTSEIPTSKLQEYVSSISFHIFEEEGKFLDVKELEMIPFEEVPFSVKEKLLVESDLVTVPIITKYGSSVFVLDNKFTKKEISPIIMRLLAQFEKQMQLLIGDFQLREELKKLAYNDELTGVKNRRVIRDFEKQQGALVMIDLDKFKYINDTLGHEAGDNMLKDFTFMAEKVLRTEDAILRYGGDEFLLVLKDVDVEQAKNVVKRLREYSLRNSISFSAGVAKLKSPINKSIRLADEAMYEAKRSKKGICIAKEEEAN